jgi:hypothetical protein
MVIRDDPTLKHTSLADLARRGPLRVQKAKYSLRADVFRFAPINGHRQIGPVRAMKLLRYPGLLNRC